MRVLFEVGVVIPQYLNIIAVPIGAVIIFMALTAVALFYLINKKDSEEEKMQNYNKLRISAFFFE